MNEPKRKRGRPINAERRKLEEDLGVSARRVQQLMKELGADGVKGMGELRVLEKQILISWRHARGEREKHELETAKRIEDGSLIRLEFALKKYVGALTEIRQQLANVPDRLCAQLNPENPEIARSILWTELERIGAAVTERIQTL